MRTFIFVGGALGMLSCDSTNQPECTEFIEFEAFFDLDQDGYGADSAGRLCELEPGMVKVAGDCDDTDATISPVAEELCNGLDDDCKAGIDDGFELTQYWYDEDRDGYGSAYPSQLACDLSAAGWVENSDDCDDLDPQRNPTSQEICNGGVDDDCDNLSEETDPDLDLSTKIRWYEDNDADGFGNALRFTDSCIAPSGFVSDDTDCNDGQDSINPAANEVCNDGIDDDCDVFADDDDPSLDPTSLLEFFEDADGDGFGNQGVPLLACAPDGNRVDNDLDCNDTDASISPGRDETLCDLIDNDCDALTTDDVDSDFDGFFHCVDDCNDKSDDFYPGAPEIAGDQLDEDCNGYESCYSDVDADGYRTDVLVQAILGDAYCQRLPDARPELPIDCDDNDPAIAWTGNWLTDGDLDGVGFGVTALVQCEDPGVGYAAEEVGQDCDDQDSAVSPIAIDPCDDGFDWNCDGTDTCLTCKDILEGGGTTSATYEITPQGFDRDVWCDQTTDGGGWTLVAASTSPLDDMGGIFHDGLGDLSPNQFKRTIWDALRLRIQNNSDIRFACQDFSGGPMLVDLSFYDNSWYMDFTTGIDADSCFYEDNGLGAETPPARRDNINVQFRPYGDQYAAGFLEGEDSCADEADFAVDFDERGMDGALWDDGDWGESNGRVRCETLNNGGGFFLFVRELD